METRTTTLPYTPLFVTGLMRSGTTIMSKALNAHSQMAVADDPFFQFFKAFRNEIFHANGYPDFDNGSPVSDNFMSPYQEINRTIKEATFSVKFKHKNLEEVKEQLHPFVDFYTPRLVPLVKNIQADSYQELFLKLLETVRQDRGNPHLTVVGFKNTFAEQFISPLVNTFPTIKIIHMLRDPRAVFASQSKSRDDDRYPLLFILRHWRKSVAYALEHKDNPNHLLVRYEDFIANPQREMERISSFIGIPFEQNTIEPSTYGDNRGGQWAQNSSYDSSNSKEITNKFAEKWKEVLSTEVISLIEDLCEPEMKWAGYDRITPNNIKTNLAHPPKMDFPIHDWIKKYKEEFELNEHEAEKEWERWQFINGKKADGNTLRKVFIIDNFISKIIKMRETTHF